MAEIDYQLALLLQHKFEQEAKKPKLYDSDVELAKALQEQFRTEIEVESPNNGLVYKTTKASLNSSKCLTDPSWEVIDPTPDIHVLFMSFNDRFFWNKLVTVCVSWSKRMTTCAGICSYQGRGGLCSITLSEPLLKLRPRKDLVETLLHEMIHAYLFVTNNNRDRDGHGPEFHKHMFRINKEAGTNITVYHDFHDEVRLYKQHWWRCDGPCQKWKPYFGMVRRAMNRAPGPNDRWWGEHSRNCGGNFIKVKEPEKPQVKQTSSKENVKPKEDIRKYVSSVTKGNLASISKSSNSTSTSKPPATVTNTKTTNKIHTISNSNDNSKKVTAVIPNANIFGFNGTHGNLSDPKRKVGGTAVNKGSGTIVINKKPSASIKSEVKIKNNSSGQTTQQDRVLSESSVNEDNRISDYSAVRNHWLNKFPNKVSNGVKRAGSHIQSTSEKVPKISMKSTSNIDTNGEKTAECLVCLEPISLIQFNDHLDECLKKPKTRECIICGNNIIVAEYEFHVTNCYEKNFDDIFDKVEDSEIKTCTLCEEQFPAADFDVHVQNCLLKFYNDVEEKLTDKDERVNCLTCSESILKSDLDSHLDDCPGLSNVFKNDKTESDKKSDNSCDSATLKFNCPFCMILVLEDEMSAHIESCLNTASDSTESQVNKSLLLNSFSDEDLY